MNEFLGPKMSTRALLAFTLFAHLSAINASGGDMTKEDEKPIIPRVTRKPWAGVNLSKKLRKGKSPDELDAMRRAIYEAKS